MTNIHSKRNRVDGQVAPAMCVGAVPEWPQWGHWLSLPLRETMVANGSIPDLPALARNGDVRPIAAVPKKLPGTHIEACKTRIALPRLTSVLY